MAYPILTPALSRLRADFDAIAPGRDHSSDGWIGDYAHQQGTSGHNPDDTAGSKSEYSDSDNIPEVRALDVDVDLNNGLTMETCVQHILKSPNDLKRLKYIIYNRRIWTKSSGWRQAPYSGPNPHDHHAHYSGDPAYDNDTSPWSILDLLNGAAMFVSYGQRGPFVEYLQLKLKNLRGVIPGADPGTVDGVYGDGTKRAVAAFEKYCGVTADGSQFSPKTATRLDAVWAKMWTGGQVDALGRTINARISTLEAKVDSLPAGEGLRFPMTVTINEVK